MLDGDMSGDLSDGRARSRAFLRVVTVVTLVVTAIVAAVMLANRDGAADDERAEAVEQWSTDLDSWAGATLERLGPEATPAAGDHDLAALFEIAWTQPVRYPDEHPAAHWDDVDVLNAACTATTTHLQSIQDAVQPPAPPAGLDIEHPQAQEPAERFDTYQSALAGFQAQGMEQASVVRPFCGTYPALVAAHADAAQARAALDEVLICDDDGCTVASEESGEATGTSTSADGADSQDTQDSQGSPDSQDAGVASLPELAEAAAASPNEQIGASLATQCYLAALQAVCTADAVEARELTEALRTWAGDLGGGEPADIAAQAGADLAPVRAVVDDAAAQFPEAASDLGGDRPGVEQTAREALEQVTADLRQAGQDLAETLGTSGTE